MRGWECVVNGFFGGELEFGEDARSATVKLLGSSGPLVEKTIPLPSIVYRGVWKAQDYDLGDCVTKDGSTWIAVGKPDHADVPGTSKMWQMSVRKGRDGRDELRAAALSPVRLS
jgi:hypothetical protein